jgi:glycosyltransferase involved in cell wall biosynthesis/ADP-heptose:LPS heptosyltransferase
VKILVVSNIYPPYFVGGYELGCRNLVEAIMARGHEVRVLTSTYGVNRELVQPPIYRLLRINFDRLPSFPKVVRKEAANQYHFRQLCVEFAPDIVFCWNMSNISLSIAAIAADLKIPVRYYLFDNWLATCELDQWFQYCLSLAPLRPLLKALLPRLRFLVPGDPCPLDGAIFASSYLKEVAHLMGKEITAAPVVRWGVPALAAPEVTSPSPASVLYVGQVVPLKGVHTVVEAVGILKAEHGVSSVSLTVVGDIGFDPEYVRHLEDLAERYGISDRVCFTGKVAPEEVGSYLNSHGLFIFPSAWDEPFGISQVEAMAAGMIVLGTATGGSAEIIEDGVNGLRFEREDCRDCARQILRLLEEPELCRRLIVGGRASAAGDFNFNRVVDELGHLLEDGRRPATGRMASSGKSTTGTAPVPEAKAGDLVRRATVAFHKVLSTLILACVRLKGKGTTVPMAAGITLFVAPGDASDLILVFPFLRGYAEKFPGRKLVVATRPEVAPLLAGFSGVGEVIPFPVTAPAGWQRMTRGHLIWWRYGTRLPALLSEKVDTAVSLGWRKDASGAAGATVLATLKAGRKIGFRDAGDGLGRRILDFFVADGPVRRYPWSGVVAMSALFASLGVALDSDLLATVPTGIDVLPDEVADFVRSAPRPVVAIAPGGDSLCCWPVERYAEVGQWLQTECGASLLILGLESDQGRCHELHRRLPAGRKLLLTGPMPADELFAALSEVSVVFGNDNCFFYAAALAGRPVVGVFGPTSNDRLELVAGRQQIVRISLPCSPCGCDCLYNRPRCLDGVDTERVKKTVRGRIFAEHYGDILLSPKETESGEPGYMPARTED